MIVSQTIPPATISDICQTITRATKGRLSMADRRVGHHIAAEKPSLGSLHNLRTSLILDRQANYTSDPDVCPTRDGVFQQFSI
jgi:hypothetical protein